MKKPLFIYEIEALFISIKAHGLKDTLENVWFDIKNGTWR